jgi:hypothetical protein
VLWDLLKGMVLYPFICELLVKSYLVIMLMVMVIHDTHDDYDDYDDSGSDFIDDDVMMLMIVVVVIW